MTVAVGYGHFGTVANHEANSVWGVTAKWEFQATANIQTRLNREST